MLSVFKIGMFSMSMINFQFIIPLILYDFKFIKPKSENWQWNRTGPKIIAAWFILVFNLGKTS